MSPPIVDLTTALDRARELVTHGNRAILGLTGPPGAGKTTVGALVAAEIANSVVVPMDGFHLADVQLERLGRLDRKGAADTFDARGYLALLHRLRDADESAHTVFAPGFERTLEQPVAGSIAIDPSASLVITEGNYLLLDVDPWPQVATVCDQVWFVEANPVERRRRLIARHVEFGKSPAAAESWVSVVDDANAELVDATRDRADLVIRLG